MQKILYIFIFFTGVMAATAQKLWQKQGHSPSCPVCYASGKTENVYIPPPPEILNALKSAEKTSEFVVTYSLFPPEAKPAFEYAVGIWERLIESPVPIHIQANWRPKGQNVLGSCSPETFKKNFNGAPRRNIYYPVALAEKITGTELTGPNQPDMTADFSKDINWYFGIDGKTPGQLYDFVSVVLHEIGHGLGFTGFFFIENNTGNYSNWSLGDATSFDRMVERFNGDQLINTSIFNNPSVQLKNALVSGSLYSNSPVAFADDGLVRPRLYAPSVWNDGSSIYHLNDATYPSNNINSLMTHSMGTGQAIHNPGPVTLGILADIGWKIMNISCDPLKDREEVAPVHVEVTITSDYPLDSTQLFVVFSSDSFDSQPDSLPLQANETGIFEANWIPGPETQQIQYYISAGDIKKRIFRKPSEAPLEFFMINFGPDTVKPVIAHDPIPFFFDTGEKLLFVALVDDNLGVDTVFVEYSVNGVEQQPFGLVNKSATVYSAPLPVENNLLNDGDEITYQIVATDASVAQNRQKLPAGEKFSFKVEKMYEPVTGYFNNFDNATSDFILVDFRVFTEKKFNNGALHSPHPYPSPDEDDTEFNFVTLLKYPIILMNEAIISFDEIVLIEPGSPGTLFGDFEFWDYVIVEGSKNWGETWLPLVDGYDSRANANWDKNYNTSIEGMNSTISGSPEWYVNRRIEMLKNGNFSAGDTILIRFRLFSDPYAHGWGWAIDNLRIQSPVSAPQTVLSPGNILVYPNPFTGTFTIVTDTRVRIDELQFNVFNIYGQKITSVIRKNITGPLTTEIDIDNGASGMYLLVVSENGRQVLTKKLIHK